MAEKSGKEFVLIRNTANIFRNTPFENALAFERLIKRLQKNMSTGSDEFTGSFQPNCQRSAVPSSLLAVVNLLLYGSSGIRDCKATQPALSISQLILFNFKERIPSGQIVRHHKTREPPLSIYMALSTYSKSRSKDCVDDMHRLGLSISSNRLMEVTSALAQTVIKIAEEEKVLCPPTFRRGLFTVGAYPILTTI